MIGNAFETFTLNHFASFNKNWSAADSCTSFNSPSNNTAPFFKKSICQIQNRKIRVFDFKLFSNIKA